MKFKLDRNIINWKFPEICLFASQDSKWALWMNKQWYLIIDPVLVQQRAEAVLILNDSYV